MKANPASGTGSALPSRSTDHGRILSAVTWIIALALVALALYLGWRVASHRPFSFTGLSSTLANGSQARESASGTPLQVSSSKQSEAGAAMPAFNAARIMASIFRRSDLHTSFPDRPDEQVRSYTVSIGDSVFEIAANFEIKPETVLWANYDQLNDNPDMISVGMPLLIPPANGVLYKWQAGDTVEGVAGQFKAKPDDILAWSGNDIDLAEPVIEPGSFIFIPGGQREFRQWLIPTIARGHAGVSPEVYGSGACSGDFSGAYGSGAFIWPAANHVLSGNDYWSGHLGIDIAAGEAPRFTPLIAAWWYFRVGLMAVMGTWS